LVAVEEVVVVVVVVVVSNQAGRQHESVQGLRWVCLGFVRHSAKHSGCAAWLQCMKHEHGVGCAKQYVSNHVFMFHHNAMISQEMEDIGFVSTLLPAFDY
jgi:hypothetical protein